MQRTREHITDDKGDALLRGALSEWAINRVEKDYGSDYVIEVFRDGKSTGLKLDAQLKSSTVTAFSADGTFISEKLDVKAAEYLARCLKQPTFLFHADVEKGQIYWTAIQLDGALLTSLEKGETSSITVRIPTSNSLPQAWERFLKEIEIAQMTVLRRALRIADDTDFVDAMRNQPVDQKEALAEDLQQKAFRVKLHRAYEIFQSGDYAESKRRILQVVNSPDASLEVRFNGTAQLGDVEWTEIITSNLPQSRASEQLVKTGRDLLRIANNGPQHLRLYALIARTAGELAVIIHKHHGLSMNWNAHRASGRDPLWMAVLTSRLSENSVALRRKYNQCVRLVRIVAHSRYRWDVGDSVLKIAREVPGLVAVFASAGFVELATKYRQSAYQLLRMAAALATETKDDDGILRVIAIARTLDASESGDIYNWSRSLVERWPIGSEYRRIADEHEARMKLRKSGIKLKNDVVSSERTIIENMLTGIGIDPSSQPWADSIDRAIKDHDLGRALKGCEHTFITPGAMPPILRNVGLELAGPKVLHCTLYRYKAEGLDLDSVNAEFTSKYCSSCKDKSPRSADWIYTHEFQDAENARWKDQGF